MHGISNNTKHVMNVIEALLCESGCPNGNRVHAKSCTAANKSLKHRVCLRCDWIKHYHDLRRKPRSVAFYVMNFALFGARAYLP